jgi:twitching motility two-component system response regulator PilH
MLDDREREPARASRAADDAREWLTLGQAATFLGAAPGTVRKWADGGRLPTYYTPGRHRRFLRSDLDAFLARSRRAAPAGRSAAPGVLVVDDDAGLREFIRVHLEAEGYSVREAASASEGLAALDEEPPDLILLDVLMPQMDGWEMLRRVHERHGVDAIQVVMYSGEIEEAERVEERGAHAFIGKPFDAGKLLAATKQLLRS